MKELFDLSFSPANILPTVFLLFVMLYWLVFLLGFIDLGFLNFDADFDAEIDVDVDVDVDIDIEADVEASASGFGKEIGHSPGIGIQILQFLNIGTVPFMVFFSAFALFYWSISILGNHYWAEENGFRIFAVLSAGFLTSALFAKLFTQPFRKLFIEMDKGEKPIDMIGKICTMDLGIEPNKLGQAKLVHGDKHILITVKAENGIRIPKGKQVVIMEVLENQHAYLVESLEAEIST